MKPLARFLLGPQTLLGLAIVLAFVWIAAAAPSLAPFDESSPLPYFSRIGRRVDTTPHPPSLEAPFGTLSGQFNVYYTVIWGTRSALRFGLVVAASTALVGVLVGAVSGYAGGWIQRLTIPITDAFLAFPAIAGYWVVRYSLFPADPNVLTTFVQGIVVRLGLDPLMVALILFSWMPYARITSTSTMRLRQIEYVQAARALGAGGLRIVLRHIVPNLIAPVVVLAARDVGGTVMLAAAFTFIGIGGDLPWGELLAIGRDWIIGPGGSLTAYWWIYAPVTAALLLFGIGWNLLGDGFNDLIAGRRSLTIVDMARKKWFQATAALVLGIALGLTYSWVVNPVRLVDAAPEHLSPASRQDYVRAAADSFSLNLDVETALRRYRALGANALSSIYPLRRPQAPVPDPSIEGYAFAIDSLAGGGIGAAAAPDRSGRAGIAAGVLAALLVAGVVIIPRTRRRRPAPPPTAPARVEPAGKSSEAAHIADRPGHRPQSASLAEYRAVFTAEDGASGSAFAIEGPTGEFLGECGVASTDLLAADPALPAPALDVWLFDKHGLQTVNAFVIPPGLAHDAELKRRLARRGQVHAAQAGLRFNLESQRLRLDACLDRVEVAAPSPGGQGGIRRAELQFEVRDRPPRDG